MENAKQKAIEVAYGSLYEKYKESINSEGYVRFGSKGNSEYIELNTNVDFEEKEWIGYYFLRPKSLAGIETNNNWISIHSEDDLPEQGGDYYVVRNGKVETAIYVKNNRWIVNGNDYPKTTNIHSITHYQIINKPNSPIY